MHAPIAVYASSGLTQDGWRKDPCSTRRKCEASFCKK